MRCLKSEKSKNNLRLQPMGIILFEQLSNDRYTWVEKGRIQIITLCVFKLNLKIIFYMGWV